MFKRATARLGSVLTRSQASRYPDPKDPHGFFPQPSVQFDILNELPEGYETGLPVNYAPKYDDLYDKHRTRVRLDGHGENTPFLEGRYTRLPYNTFVAPSATLVGSVEVWDRGSVWYNVVIKGDLSLVRIGAYANIQDNTVINEAIAPLSLDHDGSVIIGHYTTIGHSCRLQACTIEEECMVGLGSTLAEDTYMEKYSMLGAGSVLTRGSRIGTGELWVGNPAKFHRMLTEDEIMGFRQHAKKYWETATQHKLEWYLPNGTAYLEAEKLGYPVGWTEDFWGKRFPKKYIPPSYRTNSNNNNNTK